MSTLTLEQAQQLLADQELAPLMEGGLREMRELQAKCLDAGIPAILGMEACKKQGCTPKAQLVVRAEDTRQVAELFRVHWVESVRALGVEPVVPQAGHDEADPDGELPCPACGTAAPLVNGACSDCGLQLE